MRIISLEKVISNSICNEPGFNDIEKFTKTTRDHKDELFYIILLNRVQLKKKRYNNKRSKPY